MERRRVLAAGYKHHGRDTLSTTELVAAIALERGWYAPETVRALIDQARENGDLAGESDALEPTFDVGEISIPSGYEPPEHITDTPAPFEVVVDRLESTGHDKRESVAAINQLQRDAAITVDAAAILYAHGEGVDVGDLATRLRGDLADELA